jgi:response regulator RpfG family c-di-GMP phosphodiesterase
MPPTAEHSLPRGNIMIVDDNPTNLELLGEMLQLQQYAVRSLTTGRAALNAALREPPDLILLDINMPEMNGYEVCERVKANPQLSGIPVIFISALDATEDKVKGFRSGGVDYISKPIRFEEVQARVETHLKLRRAQQAEHDLLEKTLSGAVGTLWELVEFTSPALAVRSRVIREIVLRATKQMASADPWQYDLAARLCLVGCMALPEEVFEKAYSGGELTPDEDRMFRAHPETGAHLLSNIPRLEVVAEMIRRQQHPESEPSTIKQINQGAYMLHLALELDQRVYRGIAPQSALAQLRMSDRFDPRLLDALHDYSPKQSEFEVQRLPIRKLHTGMVLNEDIRSLDGNLIILRGGTALTRTWIERLENFEKVRGVQETASVRIPMQLAIGKSAQAAQGFSRA